MSDKQFHIAPERPEDAAAIEKLHEFAFGPGRFARTAYRMREGVEAIASLSHAAWTHDALIGSIRFSPVAIEDRAGLMLGPLVIDPAWKGRGVGLKLMQIGLEAATSERHGWVILVGDEPYYARAGFSRVAEGRIRLPGPVDPARLLALALNAGALDGLAGVVRPVKNGA
ncbi:MAG: N-acetyltransferase [Hyphomicrobiales bacterium]|nr:N-acetyltransferase [Hyphomicrobiales bacterium]